MSNSGGNGKQPTSRGRGLLLDLIKRQQAEQEQQEIAARIASQAASSAHANTPPIARGRADLLSRLRPQPADKEQLPQDSSSSESSAPVLGGGRASLLKKLITQAVQAPQQQIQQDVKPGIGKPDSSGVLTQLERLSVEDSKSVSVESSEPVIKHGECGDKINLATNYVNITFDPGCGIFQYHVKFIPNIESIQIRRHMLNQHLNVIGETRNFDGSILYVPRKLSSDNPSLDCTHPDGNLIQMQLTFKNQVQPSQQMLFFNNLMKRVMSALKLVPIGRQNFCPDTGHKLPQHHLELWPGYVTSISEVEGGLKLCIDATHRAIRTETVRDFLNNLGRKNPKYFQKAAMNELIGTSVITRYNNKVYRIDDIDFELTPKTAEFDKGDKKLSLIQYYQEHWNIKIMDPNQPLLVHKATKLSQNGEKVEQFLYLVPELCNLAGLTDSIRSDFKVMRDMAEITQLKPDKRRETIRNFFREVQRNPAASKILSNWGITMSDDILSFNGRVLPSETVFFGNNKVKVNEKANWSNEAVRNAVLETPNLNSWAIIYTEQDKRTGMEFIKMLHNVKKSMQIAVAEPFISVIRNDRTDTYVNELRKIINDKLELVVIIFPTNRQDRYSAVKKICCAEIPIASQVIISKTISRPDKLKSVVEKIALQINCKLGGTLWSLQIPVKKTMIIGVDVYHTGAGRQGNSVVGFVASIDPALTKWYSKTCMQYQHQEMIDVLNACLKLALISYSEYNKCYPERIIMYRDGVGDGQLSHVKLYEVPQLIATVDSIQPGYKPQLGVIIVQKRINTRLLALKADNSLGNVPPGTVADKEITRRNYYDFYLVPQTANRGTITPTHYIVLHDESGLSVDHVQRLSYKLCHLYYNWPGTIRVPAPCQYAHKIAYLIGQNVQMEPHDSLSKKLYYL